MIDLSIIQTADVPAEWLSAFKAYAAVPDSSQDQLLESLLLRSIISVQEMADRSILDSKVKLFDDDSYYGVRLYMSVKEIESVKDGEGAEVSYTRRGKSIFTKTEQAEVIYTTEANAADVAALLPVVYQYATALYDGQDSRTLANILMQCL